MVENETTEVARAQRRASTLQWDLRLSEDLLNRACERKMATDWWAVIQKWDLHFAQNDQLEG